MKVCMIIGSHPRHLYIARKVMETGMLTSVVVQSREPMVSDEIPEMSEGDQKNYRHHFELRDNTERKYFGKESIDSLRVERMLKILPDELNSNAVRDFLKADSPDMLLTYGPDLLSEEIIAVASKYSLNIHGGLSPWYKGSATHFWPFYFLEPTYVGNTIHRLAKKIDAGNIIHQVVPKLEYGDTMHEVACKTVRQTGIELRDLLMLMDRGNALPDEVQRKTGKLFLTRDWRPEHLRLIYELYEDKIVDRYLDGEIKCDVPKLIRAF